MKNTDKTKGTIFSFSHALAEVPKFSYTQGKQDWIMYGAGNDYPSTLVDLYTSTDLHATILNKKVNMTAGKGWDTEEISPALEAFYANPNAKDDLDIIAKKNAFDLMIYGAYALIITWSKDRKSIARIQYGDVSKIRIAKEIEEREDAERFKRQESGVEFFYVSKDWTSYRKDANKPELMQGFSEEFNDEPTQLIYVTEYVPTYDTYTLPDYISGLKWIDTSKELATFHNSSIKNGFTPSLWIKYVDSNPTEEEKALTVKGLEKTFKGAANASKTIVSFSESVEQVPLIEPINLNDSDDRFLMLDEQSNQHIISSHQLTSGLIIGLATEGKLGATNEILDAERRFQASYIASKQLSIEKSYQKLAEINGIDEKLQLNTSFTVEEVEEVEDKNNKFKIVKDDGNE